MLLFFYLFIAIAFCISPRPTSRALAYKSSRSSYTSYSSSGYKSSNSYSYSSDYSYSSLSASSSRYNNYETVANTPTYSNSYWDKSSGRTSKPFYVYYIPPDYYNATGYYSEVYLMTYYNGYGYNFYYGEYGYYEYSVNAYTAEGSSAGWFTFLLCGFCCFKPIQK